MSSLAWVPLYTHDFLADVGHLGNTELGIYMRLLLVYYRDSKKVGALVAHRAQLDLGVGFGITSWLQVTGEVAMSPLRSASA